MRYFIFKPGPPRVYLATDGTWTPDCQEAVIWASEDTAYDIAAKVGGDVVDLLKELYREQPNNLTKAKP